MAFIFGVVFGWISLGAVGVAINRHIRKQEEQHEADA